MIDEITDVPPPMERLEEFRSSSGTSWCFTVTGSIPDSYDIFLPLKDSLPPFSSWFPESQVGFSFAPILHEIPEIMSNLDVASVSFSDFPEDVQLSILSFLTPSEIAAFACTSKRFLSLCTSDSKLWFTLCDRRWGSKTHITKWGSGKITYRLLYRTLNEWENLIGFWRLSGQVTPGVASPPLIFFEWGPSFVIGSRVSPSELGTYQVIKAPFLCMSITPGGDTINVLDPDGKIDSSGDFLNAVQAGFLESDLIPVHVSFMGKNHFVVEENSSFTYLNSQEQKSPVFRRSSSSGNVRAQEIGVVEEMIGGESGSPGSLPDRFMSEIYQYFANRTSPSGERASRRQRKREKERQGKRKWVPEHFVKITNCSPTPSRPLQGLWKGISDDKNLYFFLVAYDDIGGISCRTIGDSSKPLSGYSPVFWTSKTTFLEAPFSPEEECLYDSRIHLRPADHNHGHHPLTENEVVSHILCINSSYDLVIPDLAGTSANPWDVEGRIWLYENGTFGFGFLRNHFIVDLKHIAEHGCLLDTMESL